jgi:sigma-B regulation protein RsbU (phosphoserine phosphatase)
VTQGIVGRSVRENRCQRVFDVREDPNFFGGVDQETGFVTRSILSAPMAFADETLGAVQLVNKRVGDGRFGEADAHLLQVLASSAALAIANARMATRLVEAERVRRELELAAEIQRNLLPPPRPRPFPIFGVNVPARTVSGDFFDILPRSDGRIAFCLGDVSGKGVNAALLMAKTASLYRCLARSIDRPGRVLRVLNDELAETSTRGMFVTMVAGLFDPEKDVVWLANAGHPPALWHGRSGEFQQVEADAPPLGMLSGVMAEEAFPEREVAMQGGALYVFSDGLTEAWSAAGEQLEIAGLQGVIAQQAHLPLIERVAAILDAVSDRELRDDVTLLGVQREA